MDSSFDDDELIKELGDIGLAFSETKESDKTSKEKPKPKNNGIKKRPPPKRRPPSKIHIDLDDLMDGVDETPIYSVTKETETVPKTQKKEVYSLEGVENRITSYLAMQIRTLVNTFSVEVDKMFRDANEIDPLIDSFIDEIRQDLRESCKLDISNDTIPTASSLFEPFSLGFSETFRNAKEFEQMRPKLDSSKTQALNVQLASYPSNLNLSFDRAVNEITTAINERDIFSAQQPVFDNKQMIVDKYKRLSLVRYELECKIQMLEQESKYVQKEMSKLDKQRISFTENFDRIDSDENETSNKILKKVDKISDLISRVNKPYAIESKENVKRMIDELDSMRRTRDIGMQQMFSVVDDSRFMSQRSDVPMNMRTVNYVPSNIAVADEYDAASSSILNTVRNKLTEVRNQREIELQNATAFLDSMKRKEKRRRRNHHTTDLGSQL